MSCVNLKNNRYKVIHTYNANVYRVMDELSTCVYILKICPDYEIIEWNEDNFDL